VADGTPARTLDRAALVTGSASPSGIGAGIARRLASRGYSLLLMDLDQRVRTTSVDLCQAFGLPAERVVPWVGDVADDGQVAAAVAEAVQRFGRLDVAVANAGGGGSEADLIDLETTEFDRIVSLNIRGTYLTCKAAGLVMRAAGRGAIVTLSSIFGQEPVARTAPYAAAKAAVIAMTHVLARELAPYNVRVNSVAPGYIETEALIRAEGERAARAGLTIEQEQQRVDKMVPLGRHGTADDVAAAVEFLVSDDARYITGHTLGVSGGIVMR
jgi:NAD(P)-dependent dehydrogenase (short-subunit alcohol dehydrogenase family)